MNTFEAYIVVSEAFAAGEEWGEQEVEAWRDQHDGSMEQAPAWTRGTYCGTLPDDTSRELVEAMIDLAAERVWDAARKVA